MSSQRYSLFAVATATSAATVQNAIDDDLGTGTARKYQFRLNQGSVGISVFNSSTGIGVYGSNPMTVEEMSRGFTMGAAVSPTQATVFQNKLRTQGTLTSVNTPNASFWVGNLKRGTTQPWSTGAISLVAGWSRTLSDAEMLSLADNPWQLFQAPDDDDFFAAVAPAGYTLTAATGTFTMTGQPAGTRAARKLPVSTAAFSLTANPAGTRVGRKLVAASAFYGLTGNAVGLSKSAAPASGLLVVAPGSYVINGRPVTLRSARRLSASVAAYSMTGYPVGLTVRGPVLTVTWHFNQLERDRMPTVHYIN